MRKEQRSCIIQFELGVNHILWKELLKKTKSFDISKKIVMQAFKLVKANKGAAGVDLQSISSFEENLKDNLYKIWNRMSSGTYFPPPVRTVEIPKKSGGNRVLGIPTVSDRIAQMVVKLYFEPKIEPHFHKDSYGYRPGKSAIQAVGITRQRCWRHDWLLEFDIKGLFDNIDHTLLMRAVEKHTDCKWILLYIKRWLKAPFLMEDGKLLERTKGTPQGGVVSPLLANLFLHYVFDKWMQKYYSQLPFARYADDAVVHCLTETQAKSLKKVLENRFKECKLEIHPDKTKIVYCKDDDRREKHSNTKFDFLGYTFCPRRARNRNGKFFVSFLPAVSNSAVKAMKSKLRRWNLHLRSDKSLEDLAHFINPILRGWINYYGCYYKSRLYTVLRHFDRTLSRWACKKYKRLRRRKRRAVYWLGRIARKEPNLFAHWHIGVKPSIG